MLRAPTGFVNPGPCAEGARRRPTRPEHAHVGCQRHGQCAERRHPWAHAGSCAAVGGPQQRTQQAGLEPALVRHPEYAFAREMPLVFGHQGADPIARDPGALHERPQLDEVVGGRHGDQQAAFRLQHAGHLRRVPPGVERQDEVGTAIEQRQPTVGVGDDPGRPRPVPRGMGARRPLEDRSPRPSPPTPRRPRPAVPGPGPEIHHHGRIGERPLDHDPADGPHESLADARAFERRSRPDGLPRVASRHGSSIPAAAANSRSRSARCHSRARAGSRDDRPWRVRAAPHARTVQASGGPLTCESYRGPEGSLG